jgi:hypothetical protein
MEEINFYLEKCRLCCCEIKEKESNKLNDIVVNQFLFITSQQVRFFIKYFHFIFLKHILKILAQSFLAIVQRCVQIVCRQNELV